MILHTDIHKLNITEDIITHFFSKTKLADYNINNIELIRTNKISHVLKVSLEPNKAKRTHTTLEININKLRDYKLNKILNNETI